MRFRIAALVGLCASLVGLRLWWHTWNWWWYAPNAQDASQSNITIRILDEESGRLSQHWVGFGIEDVWWHTWKWWWYGPNAQDASLSNVTIRILDEESGRLSQHWVGFGIEDVNHELYGGLYSQMVYGEAFEEPAGPSGVSGDFQPYVAPWNSLVIQWLQAWVLPMAGVFIKESRGAVSPTWTPLFANERIGENMPLYEAVSEAFTGRQAQLLRGDHGNPAQILNRGLYRQGYNLIKNHHYEGYLYLRAPHAIAGEVPRVNVSLVSANNLASQTNQNIATVPQRVLDSVFFEIHNESWTRLDFELTPSETAGCQVVKAATGCVETPEGECILCDGGIAIAVSHGAVVIDFVFLQPGPWGCFEELPVRKDAAELLKTVGVNVLRLGGSMLNVEGYRWKTMRGPREERQPYPDFWHPFASRGWQIFEFLDLCEKLGVQAVVTFNDAETSEDMADLIEYAHGGVDTVWGKRRVLDRQRTEPYVPFVIEIGNERSLDSRLARVIVESTLAMRARADAIGLDPHRLQFAIGFNPANVEAIVWPTSLRSFVLRKVARFAWLLSFVCLRASKLLSAFIGQNTEYMTFMSGVERDLDSVSLPKTEIFATLLKETDFLGESVLWDIHLFGDVPQQGTHFANMLTGFSDLLEQAGSKSRIAVLEENSVAHDLSRGLLRARMANFYPALGNRFAMTTAANGFQVMGLNDNHWDQGALFLAPDRAWLSPYGHANYLVSRASEVVRLRTAVDAMGNTLDEIDIAAEKSNDSSILVLRIVNFHQKQAAVSSVVAPRGFACGSAWVAMLKAPSKQLIPLVNPPSNQTLVSPEEHVLHGKACNQIHGLHIAARSMTVIRWTGCEGLGH